MTIRIAILAVALLGGTVVQAATPASTSASPCAAGSHLTTIRTSRIKPGGSMAAFRKAEADQEAWYAAHHLPDRLFVAPVVSNDGGKLAVSATEALTFHVHKLDRSKPFPPRDAAWNAFVAAFKANSEIVSTRFACLPD